MIHIQVLYFLFSKVTSTAINHLLIFDNNIASISSLYYWIFPSKNVLHLRYQASLMTFWSSFPRDILFSVAHELINEISKSFQPTIYLFRERDLMESEMLVPPSSTGAFALLFDPFFFWNESLRNCRGGTHFQQRGFFSGFLDVDYLIRIVCLVKGILGGFGTKDLLDSLLDKSTSPFRIASELLLLRRNHPWERAEPRNSLDLDSERKREEGGRELSEERLVNLESLFNFGS